MVFRDRRERGVVRLSGSPLAAYPIGAVYISDRLVDPATLFGGTWARFAQGKVLVGVDETDTQFDTPLEIGGEKTHVLAEDEMADHTHGGSSLTVTSTGSAHTHGVERGTATGGSTGRAAQGNTTAAGDMNSTTAGSGHTHTITGSTGTGTGQNKPHNNLQPFITVYMWRRTA